MSAVVFALAGLALTITASYYARKARPSGRSYDERRLYAVLFGIIGIATQVIAIYNHPTNPVVLICLGLSIGLVSEALIRAMRSKTAEIKEANAKKETRA